MADATTPDFKDHLAVHQVSEFHCDDKERHPLVATGILKRLVVCYSNQGLRATSLSGLNL
eukprot:4749534-Amphidinium_carterae.2